MPNVIEVTQAKSKNISFSEPKKIQVKGSNNTFQRISIDYLYESRETAPLIIVKKDVKSFGLWGFSDEKKGKVEKFTFNLILQNSNTPSEEEKEWNDSMRKPIKACFKHVKDNVKIKKTIPFSHEAFSPLKKTEKGVSLNVKVGYDIEKDRFFTKFYKGVERLENPHTLFKEQQLCDIALKVDSIFIGQMGVFLQIRAAEVSLLPMKEERLLQPRTQVIEESEEEEEEEEDKTLSSKERRRRYSDESSFPYIEPVYFN